VFPFSAGESRTSEIAFSFPTGLSPHIRIVDRDISLAAGMQEQSVVFRCGEGERSALVIPSAVAAALPPVRRQAYVHFIVDASEAAAVGFESIMQTMTHVQAILPPAMPCRVTMANFEFADVTPEPVPLSDVAGVIAGHRDRLPFRGAFCPERAIRSALLTSGDMAVHDPEVILTVPIFVVIKAANARLLKEDNDVGAFAGIAPDMAAYYVVRPDGRLDAHAFRDGIVTESADLPAPDPVIILRAGDRMAVCRTDVSGVVYLPAGLPIERYDAIAGDFVPLEMIVTLPADNPISQGLALMEQWEQTIRQPALEAELFKDLVMQSRRTGILIPATSYIVVENSAQWIMLERAENKSLKADKALAFDEFVETPAPPMLLLLPLLFLLLLRRRTISTI